MDPRRMEEQFTIDLKGCARCHGTGHVRLTFSKLTHPTVHGHTHWAPCPKNGEPILLRWASDAPEESS